MPRTHYLICTTPRSGSSFLCALLETTGVAGMRRGRTLGSEYLLEIVGHPDRKRDLGRLDREGLRLFLRDAFERSRTPNGVAGFKLMWEQVRRLALLPEVSSGPGGFEFDGFPGLLPEATRFVWLRRRERLRQAVSLVKAVQSACWNSAEQEGFEGSYVFDYVALERTARRLERHDAMWRDFFAHNAIVPLEIDYEDVVDNRTREVRRILDFLGVASSSSTGIGEVPYRRQSEAVNVLWAARLQEVRSWGPAARGAYAVWSLPRWIGLHGLSRWRRARRVRLSPGGEEAGRR